MTVTEGDPCPPTLSTGVGTWKLPPKGRPQNQSCSHLLLLPLSKAGQRDSGPSSPRRGRPLLCKAATRPEHQTAFPAAAAVGEAGLSSVLRLPGLAVGRKPSLPERAQPPGGREGGCAEQRRRIWSAPVQAHARIPSHAIPFLQASANRGLRGASSRQPRSLGVFKLKALVAEKRRSRGLVRRLSCQPVFFTGVLGVPFTMGRRDHPFPAPQADVQLRD